MVSNWRRIIRRMSERGLHWIGINSLIETIFIETLFWIWYSSKLHWDFSKILRLHWNFIGTLLKLKPNLIFNIASTLLKLNNVFKFKTEASPQFNSSDLVWWACRSGEFIDNDCEDCEKIVKKIVKKKIVKRFWRRLWKRSWGCGPVVRLTGCHCDSLVTTPFHLFDRL